ncbi:MAG: SlyX family protein [Candidatus Desulfovibrio faecigallinarum]|uniref:SlyX family protein n=1 Tax=Desulfovibrio sp. An276 TaxID=1965618 RepID=UPI000B39244E|nr:SlyX family protein [Desulfovibrio sp. An276]MBU3832035.1 SlyX family protein [Candidatus Desulfovibrio faecigallinarum]OUO52797.1 hypothetical protein B5F76_06565 [Desulfovibrio sp. An276]
MEERVQRLEEDNYFLSRRVRQLDEALTLQQRQLDDLERKLARMSAEVERLKEIAEEGNAPVNTPPPHYNSW